MLGIGVMLQQLSGNESSVAAFKAALGKKIVHSELTDNTFKLVFADGTCLNFNDSGQS